VTEKEIITAKGAEEHRGEQKLYGLPVVLKIQCGEV
jgi:hypothetical protein